MAWLLFLGMGLLNVYMEQMNEKQSQRNFALSYNLAESVAKNKNAKVADRIFDKLNSLALE